MAGAFDQKAAFGNCCNHPLPKAADKKSLRRAIILRRDSLHLDIRKMKDRAVNEKLTSLDEYKNAGTILLHVSFRSEVDTKALIRQALSDGRTVVLPRVDRQSETIQLYVIKEWSDLLPGAWGILEPFKVTERVIDIERVDVVIAPGVAFDQDCNRIGYGKGYYDKLLNRRRATPDGALRPLVIGIAYEEQIVPTIPCSPHDMKMDLVITDKRTIYCHEQQED